ncbi:hypothetical protein HB364_02270 [Pseudoflavitalea sp. X16]|uniref:hypothetical protein n=1 Tax=Paraflavitalea devenefica TaxID=2716334 RepID=UPI00142066E1|nr:hypothetical protein [Paraflavitalea devenefica]NII23888.1 hypothetical protein [Paraflavitalea devenefica]
MKTYQSDKKEDKNLVEEPAVQYGFNEEQEKARLKEALKRTDTEKFHFLMTLMKMGNTMRKAVIHHKK